MALTQVTVLADDPGQVQVRGGQLHAQFLLRLATGTGVGRLALVGVQLPAARAPETEIRLLRTFEQQHLIALIETIKQRGDAVWQF